jgi:hypothetical protein
MAVFEIQKGTIDCAPNGEDIGRLEIPAFSGFCLFGVFCGALC